MDDDKLEMQLHIIRVTYRKESKRLPADALQALRLRAAGILDRLEREADADPARLRRIGQVRAELGASDPD